MNYYNISSFLLYKQNCITVMEFTNHTNCIISEIITMDMTRILCSRTAALARLIRAPTKQFEFVKTIEATKSIKTAKHNLRAVVRHSLTM